VKKFSNYAFWIAFVGALVVFLEDIEALFGIDINTTLIESIILSFCGVLVVLGVVHKTNTSEDKGKQESMDFKDVDSDPDNNTDNTEDDK